MTAVHLTKTISNQEVNPATLEETLSLETMELTDRQRTWPIVEIAVSVVVYSLYSYSGLHLDFFSELYTFNFLMLCSKN